MAVKCPATQTLQRKLTQALSTCTACAPQVEYLETLAPVCPQIAEQIASLRLLLDHVENMSRIGLMMANTETGGEAAPPAE